MQRISADELISQIYDLKTGTRSKVRVMPLVSRAPPIHLYCGPIAFPHLFHPESAQQTEGEKTDRLTARVHGECHETVYISRNSLRNDPRKKRLFSGFLFHFYAVRNSVQIDLVSRV